MGHHLNQQGTEPDQAKVKAITNMPNPTDVQGVRHLCGMIQYLAHFLPNLSSDLEPLQALTWSDTLWVWSAECKEAFQRIKDQVTKTPVLAYYNLEKDLVLQVDSSWDGLGSSNPSGPSSSGKCIKSSDSC